MRYGWPIAGLSCAEGFKHKRPRAARYPFVAHVVLIDLESGHKTMEKVWDLSLFGCRVLPRNTSRPLTRIRVQIAYNGEVFKAIGRVTRVGPLTGIGIAFTKVEDHDQLVLEKWLAELRNRHQSS